MLACAIQVKPGRGEARASRSSLAFAVPLTFFSLLPFPCLASALRPEPGHEATVVGKRCSDILLIHDSKIDVCYCVRC